jgi:hypothetical protein
LSSAGAIAKAGLLILALVLSLPVLGWAQDAATLVGAVTDPTGAAVPNAKVEVSNPTKGFVRELTTNSAGEYTAAKIPIGDYVITAQATGFQKLVRSGITLDVGQTQRLDLQLTLGATTQEISVSGSAQRVETENATVSDVVSGSQIQDLTLVGRNYQTLTILTPGGAPEDSWDPTKLGHNSQAGISFNGTRDYYNNFEVEGGQNNDTTSGGPSPDTFPALDSIAEFRISTSDYGADVGMRAGANIQVITKSGTRDFHGSADEFVRNDHMDANDWFANRVLAPPGGNAPKTPLKWNIFGYTLGGPIYIPNTYNTDKSKTFFFWSESWARYRQGTIISSNTPTLRMRQGDFSECAPGGILADSCTEPVVNGVATTTVPINPNGQALLNAFIPLPNNGIDGYLKSPSSPTNWRQEQIRVDQNINDKTTAFFRWTQDTWDQVLIPALWAGGNFDTIESPWGVPAKNAVFHLTRTFKPNLMNEFIAAYGNDPHAINVKAGPGNPAGSILKPSTWTVNPIFEANKVLTPQNILPDLQNVSGGVPFSISETFGQDNGYYSTLETFTIKDNVVYTVGRHTLKTGVFGLSYFGHSILNYTDPQGGFWFTGGSFPGSTKNGLADMYLGAIQEYTEGTPYNYVTDTALGGLGRDRERMKQFEAYFQDDWKVDRKLTLNLGMRYTWNQMFHNIRKPTIDVDFIPSEYNPADAAQIDINGNLIPGTGQFYTSAGNGIVICAQGGLPIGCVFPDRFTWQPRFGFAYDPTGTGKTAIRGGFGVYHDLNAIQEVSSEQNTGGPPAVLSPAAYNFVGYNSIVPGPTPVTSATAYATHAAIPMIMQYNVTVQHEFSGNNFLSVAWVGTLGRHLGTQRDINQIPDGITTRNAPALAGGRGGAYCDASGNCDVQNTLINEADPTYYFRYFQDFNSIHYLQYSAISNYNSLQVNFRHTTGYGLTFQGAYTYSHALDTTTGYNGNYGVDDQNLNRWYSTGDSNRTHVLIMNYVYALPFFKNSSSGFLRNGLGGWKFSGITSFYTGVPQNLSCGVNGYNSGIGRGVQCNTLGPDKIQKGTVDDQQFGPTPTWFNPSMIAQPLMSQLYANGEPGMFGYMGRNVLTGPGVNNFDLALLKDWQTPWFKGEHSTLQFRLETFNTFNHPQWLGINYGCSGLNTFGTNCGGNTNLLNSPNYQDGEVSSARSPRLVQLGMKFSF